MRFYKVHQGLDYFGKIGVLLNDKGTQKRLLFSDSSEHLVPSYKLRLHAPQFNPLVTRIDWVAESLDSVRRAYHRANSRYYQYQDSARVQLAFRLQDAERMAFHTQQLTKLERAVISLENRWKEWNIRLHTLLEEQLLRELYFIYCDNNKHLPSFTTSEQLTLNL